MSDHRSGTPSDEPRVPVSRWLPRNRPRSGSRLVCQQGGHKFCATCSVGFRVWLRKQRLEEAFREHVEKERKRYRPPAKSAKSFQTTPTTRVTPDADKSANLIQTKLVTKKSGQVTPDADTVQSFQIQTKLVTKKSGQV